MTPEEMDRLIDDHFAYEAADDVDGVMSTVTDDIEHDVVGYPPGPQQGKAAVRAFYEQLFALLKQEGYEPLRRYYGSDSLVDEVLYTGIIDGRLVGLDGKQGRASWRLLHLLEFRDGKIARENIWQDVDAIRAQLEGAAR
jgi:ketosteroid isomerase-like protein